MLVLGCEETVGGISVVPEQQSLSWMHPVPSPGHACPSLHLSRSLISATRSRLIAICL